MNSALSVFIFLMLCQSSTSFNDRIQTIADLIAAIAALFAAYWLFISLKEMRKQTDQLKDQSDLMLKSTVVDAMKKYQEKGKPLNNGLDLHKYNISQFIIEEMSEGIMKSNKFIHHDKPNLIVSRQIDTNQGTLYETEVEIQLVLEKEVPIKHIDRSEDPRFKFHDKLLNAGQYYSLVIPKDIGDFEVGIIMESEFSGKKWLQKVIRKGTNTSTLPSLEIKDKS